MSYLQAYFDEKMPSRHFCFHFYRFSGKNWDSMIF